MRLCLKFCAILCQTLESARMKLSQLNLLKLCIWWWRCLNNIFLWEIYLSQFLIRDCNVNLNSAVFFFSYFSTDSPILFFFYLKRIFLVWFLCFGLSAPTWFLLWTLFCFRQLYWNKDWEDLISEVSANITSTESILCWIMEWLNCLVVDCWSYSALEHIQMPHLNLSVIVSVFH